MADRAAAGAECWACGATSTRASERYASLGLLECPRCGLLFDPGRPAGEVRDLYDAAYFADPERAAALVQDERSRRREAAMRVAWVTERMPAGNLLEVGSGGGWFLAELPPTIAAHGVEPVQATALASAQRLGVDVEPGFIEDVDLAPGFYDAACAWHVVEHLREPAVGLARIRAALRPGGLLFVEVPNAGSASAAEQGPAWPPLDPQHHVGHYGPDAMRALLARAGFEPLDVTSFPSARYLSPRQILWPGTLAMLARQGLSQRVWPLGGGSARHDLLRAVARRP